MVILKSRKRQITEGIQLSNQEKIRTLWEKETYEYFGILEVDTIKQVEMKKKKIKKKISEERENYSKPNCIAKISSNGSPP